MDPTLSREEIEEAIRSLPVAGWVRLRKIAVMFCQRRPLDADDLLQEVFARAIDGSRRCPRSVGIVKFLAEAMHSIASDAMKTLSRHPELRAVPLIADDGLAFDPPDCRPNAEQELGDTQETAQMKQRLLDLFVDDAVAQVMIEGMMEGMDGEELRVLVELDSTAFASKRRLIRRRIAKAFPDGWKP